MYIILYILSRLQFTFHSSSIDFFFENLCKTCVYLLKVSKELHVKSLQLAGGKLLGKIIISQDLYKCIKRAPFRTKHKIFAVVFNSRSNV